MRGSLKCADPAPSHGDGRASDASRHQRWMRTLLLGVGSTAGCSLFYDLDGAMPHIERL